MNIHPTTLLRNRHREATWAPAAWTAATGLGLLFAVVYFWHPADTAERILLWMQGLALVALATLLVRVRCRHTTHTIARALDDDIKTYNRIEAAHELAHRTDPIALAQRQDTVEFLAVNNPPKSWRWPAALALVLLLASGNLLWFGMTSYQFSVERANAAKAKVAAQNAVLAAKKMAANAPPAATLRWLSPKAETTGTPIEEIPLTAQAESVTGLQKVTLVVTVNGEAKPDVKLPADVASGRQPIELSIYLDELGVQPYDIVSYYLHADRVVPAEVKPEQPWPAVTSPLQLIQVRLLRDDTGLANSNGPPPPPGAEDLLNYIKRLKLVQIQLMKDTFALANDTPPRTAPEWPGLNKSAGTAQSSLADKTHQALDLASKASASAEIVNQIIQAEERMKTAANSLDATKPSAASTDQQHALANLAAVEKFYRRLIDQGQGQAAQPQAPDPFQVNQPFKLPPREPTPAGQLEQLARDQTKLAGQMADSVPNVPTGSTPNPAPGSSPSAPSRPSPSSAPGSSPGAGSSPGSSPGSGAGSGAGSGPPTLASMTAQQQKLAADIAKLANTPNVPEEPIPGIASPFVTRPPAPGSLPPEALPALHAAADASQEAVQQLKANDLVAATEPAARAAAHLREALAKVDAAGRANSANLLADAQHALNQSASDIAGAAPSDSKAVATVAATRTAAIAAALRDRANQQQGTGSAQAAQQLAGLANAITNSHVQDDLKKLADNANASQDDRMAVANKLAALAQGTANSQVAIGDPKELANQALDALKRDRVNLDRADQAGADALRGLQDDVLNQAEVALATNPGAMPSPAPGQAPANTPGNTPSNAPGKTPSNSSGEKITNSSGQGDGKRTDDVTTGPIEMLTPPAPPSGDQQHKPFMRMMGTQIDSLITLLAKQNDDSRPQILITGQASEAPPVYRAAVADYFESLAHDHTADPPKP